MNTETQFLSVASLAAKYSKAGFTEASIRWLLFNREHNGFNRCVIPVGRKLLIDETEFVGWLRSKREASAA